MASNPPKSTKNRSKVPLRAPSKPVKKEKQPDVTYVLRKDAMNKVKIC